MVNPIEKKDLRQESRVNAEFPATISVGTQLTVKGLLRDISLSSAFIRIKNNIFLNVNDEIGFTIQCSTNDTDELIQGLAHVSRIVVGEGIAVYFTKMDDDSLKRLKKFLQKSGIKT